METGEPPLLFVGDRDPLGGTGVPAVLSTAGTSAGGVREADVDFGSIRPATWRLPVEAPPDRRAAGALAAAAALVFHVGLLLALHRIPGPATEGDGFVVIPVAILVEMPEVSASDRADLPPLAPTSPPAVTEAAEPPAGEATAAPGRDGADAQPVTPPPPAASSPPAVENPVPPAITPPVPPVIQSLGQTASAPADAAEARAATAPPTPAAPVPTETATSLASAPLTAGPNLATAASGTVAPTPFSSSTPRLRGAPPAVVAPSRASSRETPPKAAETHAAIERAERQRLAAIAAQQARLARNTADLKRAAARRDADRAATTAARETVRAAPAASGASAEDISDYSREVASRIAATKHYPDEARMRGAQGTVVVAFSLGSAGQVTAASVRSSSGDASLDGEALSTVRRAGPFGPPPAGAPRSLSVPLRYHI